MSFPSATQILDELIAELADGSGPHERVVDEFVGSIVQEHEGSMVYPVPHRAIQERADAAVQELRKSWGPTADPHWVKGIVRGRGDRSDVWEFDCYFAIFRRDNFWGYVRIRAPETDTPETAYLRLIFGVARGAV